MALLWGVKRGPCPGQTGGVRKCDESENVDEGAKCPGR